MNRLNWYALLAAIVTDKSSKEILKLMGISSQIKGTNSNLAV